MESERHAILLASNADALHLSNGAADSTVLQIRSRAGLLVQQIEDEVASPFFFSSCSLLVIASCIMAPQSFHSQSD